MDGSVSARRARCLAFAMYVPGLCTTVPLVDTVVTQAVVQ